VKFKSTVKDVIQRTKGVKSFRFHRPEEFEYDPGQWFFVTLPRAGAELVKHFTISSSPTEPDHIEFTKKITDHEFSLALDALEKGDRAYLDGPYGTFTFTGEYPRVVLITGGIGITPFRSIIKYCSDRAVPSWITLLYGNRDEDSIVFQEELNDLQNVNPHLRIVHCLSRPSDTWKGRRGHLDGTAVREEIPDYRERVFYVCGPPLLVTDLVRALQELGVPNDRIRTENFTGY
jgi:ferredoxin-NADP reductase